MDKHNLAMLQTMRPISYRGHLGLMLAVDGKSSVVEVPDPYFGGPRDFEHVLELVERGAEALLRAIRGRLAIGELS